MALGVEGQSTRFVALRLIVEFRYDALGYERPDRLAGSNLSSSCGLGHKAETFQRTQRAYHAPVAA